MNVEKENCLFNSILYKEEIIENYPELYQYLVKENMMNKVEKQLKVNKLSKEIKSIINNILMDEDSLLLLHELRNQRGFACTGFGKYYVFITVISSSKSDSDKIENGKKSQATTKRNNENSNITKFPDVFCHVYNKQHDHKLEFFYGELSYEPYNISSNQISHANEDNLRLSKF
ncbi:8820_t:CDS:2, partial [Entrophospora sp. SA101]